MRSGEKVLPLTYQEHSAASNALCDILATNVRIVRKSSLGEPRQGSNSTLADRLDSAAGKALGWGTRRAATSA